MKKMLGLTRPADTEPADYLAELETFTQHYSNIAKVEQHLEKWLKATKSLKELANGFAETLDTDDRFKVMDELDGKQDSDAALSGIRAKMTMLEEVIFQHKAARKEHDEHLKLEKKLKNLIEKSKYQEPSKNSSSSIELLSQKSIEVKEKSEKMYKEVETVMRFINKKAQVAGSAHLVKHELNTFRVSQFEYLFRCQKLMQGKAESEPIDLKNVWKVFNEEKHDKLYEERVGVLKEMEDIDKKLKNNEDNESESRSRKSEASRQQSEEERLRDQLRKSRAKPRKKKKNKLLDADPESENVKENERDESTKARSKRTTTGLEKLQLSQRNTPKAKDADSSYNMLPEYLDVDDNLDWKQIEKMESSDK